MPTEHWCIVTDCKHGTLNGSLALGSLYLAEYQKGYEAGFKDATIDRSAERARIRTAVETLKSQHDNDNVSEWYFYGWNEASEAVLAIIDKENTNER